MEATEACFGVYDGVFDFTLECEAEHIFKGASASSSCSSSAAAAAVFCQETRSVSFPGEFVEEELEWLSNKDAFPAVETCFGILSDNLELVLNQQSPVSVLENSTTTTSTSNNNNGSTIASCCSILKVPVNFPVRPRSKRRRSKRRASFGEFINQQLWLHHVNVDQKQESSCLSSPISSMGRRCLHCQAEKTPQWRAGPMGPKTLCNACGVRYKSGRLLPEYRPASSPTFSSALHSNSHRKVVDMRRHKHLAEAMGDEVMVNACGSWI